MRKHFISTILLCGGIGSRMGQTQCPKQFLMFQGKPVALHSFELLASFDEIQEIIVVCHDGYRPFFLEYNLRQKLTFANPGQRRQDSVQNGLALTSRDCDLVLIHDSARPLLTVGSVKKLIDHATCDVAIALGVRTKSTIRHCDEAGKVLQTPDRKLVWEMQTPQIVPKNTLLKGFEIAIKENLEVTDDLALAELLECPTKIIEGNYQNIKITTKEDLLIADALYQQKKL